MDTSRSARHETTAGHVCRRRLALRNHAATSRNHRTSTNALPTDRNRDGGCVVADLLTLVSCVASKSIGYGYDSYLSLMVLLLRYLRLLADTTVAVHRNGLCVGIPSAGAGLGRRALEGCRALCCLVASAVS
jgi:hypothetical protein